MFKNAEMEQMLAALAPLLDHKDVVGYAAARNTRVLRSELKEYFERRDELVLKYGEQDTDASGNPTGGVSLSFDSPNFPKYCEEIEPFASIEHEPPLMRLKYEEVVGLLTGNEMLALEWMLED